MRVSPEYRPYACPDFRRDGRNNSLRVRFLHCVLRASAVNFVLCSGAEAVAGVIRRPSIQGFHHKGVRLCKPWKIENSEIAPFLLFFFLSVFSHFSW